MRNHLPLARAPVYQVAATRRGGLDESALAGQLVKKRSEERAGLAAAKTAQDWMRAHLACHPRYPNSLSTRMDVDVVVGCAAALDRDRQNRMGSEHGYLRAFRAHRR